MTSYVQYEGVRIAVNDDGSVVTSGSIGGNAGAGNAVTSVDGGLATIGTTTDLATANTLIGRIKALIALFPTALGQGTKAGSLSVTLASDQGELAVGDGTNAVSVSTSEADAASNTLNRLRIAADHKVFNGTTWDRQRTPNVFKYIGAVAVTAGTPVAIWTPATGKKFRLMGYSLFSGGTTTIYLKDATTNIMSVFTGSSVQTVVSPNLGNGYISAVANNVLNADVSATTTVWGYVFGTEE